MRRKHVAILALFAAAGTAMVWSGVLGAGIPEQRLAQQAPRDAAQTDVDVELVIAVDISYSMDPDEQALQREGYILGLTSSEFLNALKQGMHGKVAITYFEWAGAQDQRVVVPWRIIDGPAAARAVADEIAAAPQRRAYRTSISGALLFGAPLFQTSGHRGIRRVIDVSGDGANNQGPPVTVIARSGAGAGHYDQRPADHAQARDAVQHGYRKSRCLLRGLRHRRAGLRS